MAKKFDFIGQLLENGEQVVTANNISKVATSGKYDDLKDKPTLLTPVDVDDKISAHNTSLDAHKNLYYNKDEIDDKGFLTEVKKEDVIGLENVENKSSATIRGELTKENVVAALGYTPPTTNTTYSAITNDEIDEICSGTISTYLESIASEEVSF